MRGVVSGATSLDRVLTYRHSGVVRRYCKEQHADLPEAEEVFREMLKFLYISYRAGTEEPEGFGFVVSAEIEKIDWMWHTFLLFTKDYADFCDNHFGFFLHHFPNEAEDQTDTPLDENALREVVQKQFALVYDVLGRDTLITWYDQCRYAALA